MMTIKLSAALLACALISGGSHAAGAQSASQKMLDELHRRMPSTEFSSIRETSVPDVFEVWMGPNVAYVSSRNPRFFLIGRMLDVETMTDVTGPKLAKAKASIPDSGTSAKEVSAPLDLSSLPIRDAIKSVRGTGEHTVVVFSDPNCPYCRRLEAELGKLQNITVLTFVVPFLGMEAPVAIWCSPDRQNVWEQYLKTGDKALLAGAKQCATPMERNLDLARRLGVGGTPTLFFADGSRLSGFAEAPEIESRMVAPAAKVQPVAKANVKETAK